VRDSTYLIIVGAVAILAMLRAPKGLWALVMDRLVGWRGRRARDRGRMMERR
jgi:hypothetical protein